MSVPVQARAVYAARRHPILSFLIPVFAASGLALVVVGLPQLGNGPTDSLWLAFAMFPLMVASVAAAGIAVTALVDGRAGLQELFARLRRLPARPAWFLLVLVPPASVLSVLFVLKAVASPAFVPGFLPIGLAFGLVAGLFEEIGWTGYLYPRVRSRLGPVKGALAIGLTWGVWHLPIVDALGAASPHRAAWPFFFVAFVVALTGLRVIIARAYDATGSLPLAQLLHASSTASLVVFGAQAVMPGQEAFWYAAYAVVLWVVAAAIVVKVRQPTPVGFPARERAPAQ